MHREPESFYEPHAFHPERWLDEFASDDTSSPFRHDKREAVKPFITGPRTCLGILLAWAEMRLALAKLLWVFDVSAPESREKWVNWLDLKTILLIEKKPVRVSLKQRALVAAQGC